MILDINFLIDFFNKLSNSGTKDEMGEQEAAAPTGGGGGKVPKWSDYTQLQEVKQIGWELQEKSGILT